LKTEEAANTRLAHTLINSIGGHETDPVVTRFDMTWGHVLLLAATGSPGTSATSGSGTCFAR
jgi:hypothetical protein